MYPDILKKNSPSADLSKLLVQPVRYEAFDIKYIQNASRNTVRAFKLHTKSTLR